MNTVLGITSEVESENPAHQRSVQGKERESEGMLFWIQKAQKRRDRIGWVDKLRANLSEEEGGGIMGTPEIQRKILFLVCMWNTGRVITEKAVAD